LSFMDEFTFAAWQGQAFQPGLLGQF